MMYSRMPHDIPVHYFDIDTVDNRLYYFDEDDHYIKRTPIDNSANKNIYTHDDLRVNEIAVDWIGRYIFTYYQLSRRSTFG